MKVTAGCRFNAAERLKRREKSSNILVSVYSALLICVSIATFALPMGSSLIRYASFGGIVASILLLVMSMKNFAHGFGVEAEQMHRCALEINELRRSMQALNGIELDSRLSEFTYEYSAVLQKWSVNHTREDFLSYKYRHKWEFEDIADLSDKEMPDRKFKEYYETSAGGVAIMTLLGVAFIIFIGYVLWISIADLSDGDTIARSNNNSVSIEQAAKEIEAAADRAARKQQ